MMTRSLSCVLLLVSALTLPPSGAVAQGRAEDRPGRAAGPLSPTEVVAMLDAYGVVQAQEALQLNAEQYSQFVIRLRKLQGARRQSQQARNKILQDLRKLAGAQATPPFDENSIRERLTALADLHDQSAIELRRAHDAVDELLDVRQQARFRLFEDMIERRKLDLVMRARQSARRGTTKP